MTNPDLLLLNYMKSQPALTGLVGPRLWPGPDLPADYHPKQGPALLFGVRGGPVDAAGHTIRPSFTFRYFGLTRSVAEDTHATFYPILLSARTDKIKAVTLESVPTFLTDPATEWPFVLAFYAVLMTL